MSDVPSTTRQLRSRVDESGEVRISIETVDTPQPRSHQLLVRVEAAPINPSDLALLLAMSDVTKAESTDGAVTAPIHPAVLKSLKARVGQSLPVGNEGAGVVVAAGDSDEAQALLGKTVAFLGGGAYGEHALTTTQTCMPLPDGVDATQGASSFVNPLTALGFVETMRREGYSAIVHTAAASNLGQMLNRICLADGIPLVNVVRKPEQAQLLRDQGATHVVDSSEDSFFADLVAALKDDRRHARLRRRRRRRPRQHHPQRDGGRGHRPRARRTTATAPTSTSRSTSTAPSTVARSSCGAASASPGASAAGC